MTLKNNKKAAADQAGHRSMENHARRVQLLNLFAKFSKAYLPMTINNNEQKH
jgi:hypothetical protein